MKSLGLGLFHLTLLTVLFACGKNNESGKSGSQWSYGNPYTNGGYPVQTINSPYSYGANGVRITINQVMDQNPCLGGFGGMMGYNQPYAGQRIPIQIPLTNFPTVIAPGELYAGVTSYGDVAVVVGQGINQPPLFVAYMCPRSFSPSGQGQLMGVKIGAYTNCLIKPITAATIVFPGAMATAEFRWLDGGTSRSSPMQKIPFNFCLR